MSNAEPAKLPWSVGESSYDGMDDEIVNSAGVVVAHVYESSDTRTILEACNSYPELQAKLADTEFMRGAMQADLEAAGKLLGCDFDEVVVTLEEREKPCVWTYCKPGDFWYSGCEDQMREVRLPAGTKFCPSCGHRIRPFNPTEQSEETNE